jgi:N-acetylglucosaminyldiphosphoundecaprenol N-acetyl-beta-D-mannosaminyltransferase
MDSIKTLPWPQKYNLFGVGISATTYAEAAETIINAAKQRRPAIVTHLPVHGLVPASLDSSLKAKINSFDLVAPDGQPVRWALARLYNIGLPDRVYGPEAMLQLCGRAAQENISIYLYGSSPQVISDLEKNLMSRFPALQIAGSESPPYRPLTKQENEEVVERINDSGAGLLFLGLGFPKQDIFAYENRFSLQGVQVCVGAAFDMHAGKTKMAPPWMQRNGLEWFFRLTQEPRRLLSRYLVANSLFMLLMAKTLLKAK